MKNTSKTESLIRELRVHLGIQDNQVIELNASNTYFTIKKYVPGRGPVENLFVSQRFTEEES